MELNQFREYAKSYNVIPVTRKLLADGETPIGVYRKLAKLRPNTFLLESAEHGGVWSRYSFIGVASEATLTEKNGEVYWRGTMPAGAPTGMDPLSALRLTSPHLTNLPSLTGGLVGYLGYDSVRRLEKLPNLAKDELQIPELEFMLTSDLAVMDHSEGTITLIANVINWDGSDERVDEVYELAIKRLDQMQADLQTALPGALAYVDEKSAPKFERNITESEFLDKVAKIKEEIKSGEAFQVVLSQIVLPIRLMCIACCDYIIRVHICISCVLKMG